VSPLQLNAYTVSLFVAAVVSAGLFLYAWRRRSVTAGTELALLMLAVALWALFQGLESSMTARLAKMFFGSLSYVGSQSTPVIFLLFAVRYTQQDKWVTPKRIAMLSVLPAVSIILAFTSGVQHFLWKQVTLTHTAAGITAIYSHGIWYWVEVAYGYTLIAIGVIVLLRAVLKLPQLYAWQARLLIIATLVPLAGHIVYSFSPSSVEGLDITPIVFTLTGILVALALFKYRLLDLRPIASGVLYDGIGDAMIAVDVENRVVDINPAAQSIIEFPADQVLGQPAGEVFRSLPELVERLGSTSKEDKSELQVLHDGFVKHYDMRVWPLVDRKAHLLGKLVTLHDVTKRREAQEELKRINAELDGYAHTVSHDLKGPLAALHLASESIEKLLSLPETEDRNENIVKLAEIIVRNTRKSEELTNSLLTLAEAGQRPAGVSDVDVGKIVKRVLEERRGEIEKSGMRTEYRNLGRVRADPTHIYQLFANLVGNAIKHNSSDEPTLAIRLVESKGDLHTYRVCDNGPGVPPGDLNRIFDPFYTAGGGVGTGIGLATVARIVKVYGGEVRAYNDNGACFEFSLHDYSLER